MNFLPGTKRWCKRIGRAGESAAARMLRTRGFEILLRNCRTPKAELDIVARDGGTLVFVEVKTLYLRRNRGPGKYRPADNLSRNQKARLRRGARSYLRSLGAKKLPFRFDVVEIYLKWDGPFSIRHHMNAFPANPFRDGREA